MSQLLRSTRSSFLLPVASREGTREVLTSPAPKLPCLFWPNGRWCTPANLFLLHLYDRGLSLRDDGGSLQTYASNLSHLIRFCFERSVDFHDLTDGQFSTFVGELRNAKTSLGARARSDNQVLAIARISLDFFEYLSVSRQEPGLIGREGRIRAFRRHSRNRERDAAGWAHSSLPKQDPERRRHPLSTDHLDRLRSAILPTSGSSFLRRRRYVLLRCLEMTGGRRIEIASLRVEDVVQALTSGTQALRLLTAKRKGGKDAFRFLPCSQVDLLELWNFIKTARRSRINRTIGASADHGYVFINEKTGAPLQANTLTQEIRDLAKHAGIEDRVSPHLFRHRFITKQFVELIRQYDAHTPNELRHVLIGLKEVQQRLQEWTGHLSPSSLERYIDLAFAEVENIKVSFENVSIKAELEALKLAVLRSADEMSAHGDVTSAHALIELVAACRRQSTDPSNN